MTTNVQLGSVSTGTLRPQDLIPSFLDVMREVAPAEYQQMTCPGAGFSAVPSCALEDENDEWWTSEATGFVLEIVEVLEGHAPEYCYFGTLEGDGADFGFWVDHDALEMAITDGELETVTDTSELEGLEGFVALHINDHGNQTLYTRTELRSQDWREVWAIV